MLGGVTAMRLIVLVIIVVLGITTASSQTQPQTTPSQTQPQTTPSLDAIAAAKELTATISPDLQREITQSMVARIWEQIERSLTPQIDAATRAELRSEVERSTQQFVTDGMPDFPLIYARYFTADELRQLAAFYKTPLGAKALSQIPKVMAEFSATLAPRFTPFQQQLRGRLQAILQKHGIK
jgi:uncharacterized protein